MRRAVPVLLLVLGLVVAGTAWASSPVRISQVYGGAAGGTFNSDYVELFNNSDAPVDIGGWSLQYGSATGSVFGSATYNWAKIPAGAVIPACGYYLVRGYGSTAGAALPVSPDLVPSTGWTFNLSATAGKVALFADQVPGRTCAQAQAVAVDLVGYGTANCYETAAAPTLDAAGVLVRASGGVVDTDDNAADFARVAASGVTLHNSAGAPNPQCGLGATPPDAPVLLLPADGAADVPVPATLAVRVDDADGDPLTVRFYGRAVPPPPTGACCLPDHSCVTATAPECAAQGGSYIGDGVPCGPGFCDEPSAVQCELIVLPDTQEYTTLEKGGTTEMFRAQTQWAVANRVSRNIVAVAHEGDITDKNTAIEYDRSLTAMTLLEDPVTTGLTHGIPYAVLRGNHDATTELFNQYYGVGRFAGRGYYAGYYGTGNDHNYILFSGAGRDFVMVSLSYAPSSAVLTWARGVFDAHPGRIGILVSHSILNEAQPPAAAPWTTEGAAIYAALRGTPNLRLMLCGHMATTSGSPAWQGEGRRVDTYDGYTIHSLLADYQDRENGGNGRLRILQFEPPTNTVRVRTYSPYTNTWEADADSSSQFTLNVDLGAGAPPPAPVISAAAAPEPFALLGTVPGVTPGEAAMLDWPGLAPLTPYEWYAVVSDGHTGPVAGPTWDFTTADLAVPALMSRLTAAAVASGIELRWAFGEPGRVRDVTVERADRADGPWAAVAVENRDEEGVSVALDRGVRAGATYWYRLGATVDTERLTFGPVEATAGGGVTEFALGPPLPNPTTGATRLDLAVPRACRASLGVFDMQGRRVATLLDGPLPAGRHQATWDGTIGGRAAPAGVYFVRLRAEGADLGRSLIVTR